MGAKGRSNKKDEKVGGKKNVQQTRLADERNSEEEGEDEEVDESDDATLLEARREFFDDLKAQSAKNGKGKKGKGGADVISAKDFLMSEDMSQLVQDGDLSSEEMREMLKAAGSSVTGTLNFEQFCKVLEAIDSRLEEKMDEEGEGGEGSEDDEDDDAGGESYDDEETDMEGEDDDDDGGRAMGAKGRSNKKDEKVGGKNNTRRKKNVGLAGLVEDENDEDEQISLSEMYSPEDISMTFEELSGRNPFLTFNDLFKWEDLQTLLESKVVEKKDVAELLARVGVKNRDKISVQEFGRFANALISDLAKDDPNDSEVPVHERSRKKSQSKKHPSPIKSSSRAPSSMPTASPAAESESQSSALTAEEVEDLFKEIGQGQSFVTFQQIMQSQRLRKLFPDMVFSEEELLQALHTCGMQNDQLSLEGFGLFVSFLELDANDPELLSSMVSQAPDGVGALNGNDLTPEDMGATDRNQSLGLSRDDLFDMFEDLRGEVRPLV